ncbi:hypothetical protein ES705_36655 [subsurface metagenome]
MLLQDVVEGTLKPMANMAGIFLLIAAGVWFIDLLFERERRGGSTWKIRKGRELGYG